MSLYAFFVQTCWEEHKKKHLDASVNFSEFSKKCSERWKTMSAKEKGKFEDMAKADKARYEREMKTYIPPKGETKKKFKDPNAPKRPPSAFLFCSEYRPQIKGEHPGLSIGDVAKKLGEMWDNTAADDKKLGEMWDSTAADDKKLGEMWNSTAADDKKLGEVWDSTAADDKKLGEVWDSTAADDKKLGEVWDSTAADDKKLGEVWDSTAADDKQPCEKAAKLEEKYEKDVAAYRAKGKPGTAEKGVVKAEKSKKKKEEEDDEEDKEDEEEEEEEDEEEDDDDDE